MHKKGYLGIVSMIVLVIVFIIVLSALGSPLWTMWQNAAVTGGLSGFELFIYDNPMLLIFIGLILGIIGWIYFGS